MGALPHCRPILPVSLAGHPHYNQGHTTPQRRSWQKLIQPSTQKILNSIRHQHRKPPARHGRWGSAPPLPLSTHLATYSKMRFPTLRPPARRRNSTPSCWDRTLRDRVQRSGAGTARPSRTPSVPQHPAWGALAGDSNSPPGFGAVCATTAPPRPPPRGAGGAGGALPEAPLFPRPGPAAPRAPQLPAGSDGPTWRDPQSGWRAQCSSREGQQ